MTHAEYSRVTGEAARSVADPVRRLLAEMATIYLQLRALDLWHRYSSMWIKMLPKVIEALREGEEGKGVKSP